MQINQRYTLTIKNLFATDGERLCGSEATVAVMDGLAEIDRVRFSGMTRSAEGFRRSYIGKPGLTARVLTGFCQARLDRVEATPVA